MKFSDLFKLAVETGMQNDPRGREAVDRDLADAAKTYEKMEEKDKPFFDTEQLWNPYADSRIHNGDPDCEIRKILAGIDMGVEELMVYERLNDKGAGFDAVLAHHPSARGTVGLPQLMLMQTGIQTNLGIPVNIAEDLVVARSEEIRQKVVVSNQYKVADSARLLGIPFFNLHTPADNCVQTHLQKIVNAADPETVGDLMELLQAVPEYHKARLRGLPVRLENGNKKRRPGKIVVDMTGGTTGPKEMIEHQAAKGVGTMVVMHIPKEYIDEAKKFHINIVNVGHYASDSLGMNIVLDQFAGQGVEIVATSGLLRVTAEERAAFTNQK